MNDRLAPYRITYKPEPKHQRTQGWHQITRVLYDGKELEGMIMTKKAGRTKASVFTCYRGTCIHGQDVGWLLAQNGIGTSARENPVEALQWQHEETVNGRKVYSAKSKFGTYRAYPRATSAGSYDTFWMDVRGDAGEAGRTYKIAKNLRGPAPAMRAANAHHARLAHKLGVTENPMSGWGTAVLLIGGLAAAGVAAYFLWPKAEETPSPTPGPGPDPGPGPQLPPATPVQAQGKVFVVTKDSPSSQKITGSVGDAIDVRLYALDPSTGFTWGVETSSSSGLPVVALDADTSDPSAGRFVYRIIRPGRTVIRHVPIRGDGTRRTPIDVTVDVPGTGMQAGVPKRFRVG